MPPAQPVVPATATSSERDDVQAIAQAKLILVAWEATDGAAAAGLVDYGTNPADQSPLWGSRDNYELLAFAQWANKAKGASLAETGDLTQQKLDALVAWANGKGVATTAVTPPAPAMGAPAAAQAPAVQVIDGGDSASKAPTNVASDSNPTGTGPATPAPATSDASVISLPESLIIAKPKTGGDWALLGLVALAALAFAGGGR